MNAFNSFPKFSWGQVCAQESLSTFFPFHQNKYQISLYHQYTFSWCILGWGGGGTGGVVWLVVVFFGFPNVNITFMDPDIVGFSYVTSTQNMVCLSPQRMHRYFQGEFYFSGIHPSGSTAFPCMLPLRFFYCVLIHSSVNRCREGSLW